MDFLKKFQTQQKQKDEEAQQALKTQQLTENPYLNFPNSPKSLYAKLTELCQLKTAPEEPDTSEFTGFTKIDDDFIITADDRRSVRVLGVPRNATATDLEQKFSSIGQIKKVSQGGGGWIVEFAEEASVISAIDRISGQMLLGGKMKVELKRTMLKRK